MKVGDKVRVIRNGWAYQFIGTIIERAHDNRFIIDFMTGVSFSSLHQRVMYKSASYDYTWPEDFLELIKEKRAEDKMNMPVKEIAEKRLMMKGLVIELEDAANAFCEDSIAYQVLMERAKVERKELEAFDCKIFTPVVGNKAAE